VTSPPGEELVPVVYPVRQTAVDGGLVVHHAAGRLELPVLPSGLPVVVVVVEHVAVLSVRSLHPVVVAVPVRVSHAGHAGHDLVVGALVEEVGVDVVHPLAPCAVLGSVSSATADLEHPVLLLGVVLGGLEGGHVLPVGACVAVVALVVVLPLDVERVEFVEAVVWLASPVAVHAVLVVSVLVVVLVVVVVVVAIHASAAVSPHLVVVVVIPVVVVVHVPVLVVVPVVVVVHVVVVVVVHVSAVHVPVVVVVVVSVLVVVILIVVVVVVVIVVLVVVVVAGLRSGRIDHHTQQCQGRHGETGHVLSHCRRTRKTKIRLLH